MRLFTAARTNDFLSVAPAHDFYGRWSETEKALRLCCHRENGGETILKTSKTFRPSKRAAGPSPLEHRPGPAGPAAVRANSGMATLNSNRDWEQTASNAS